MTFIKRVQHVTHKLTKIVTRLMLNNSVAALSVKILFARFTVATRG